MEQVVACAVGFTCGVKYSLSKLTKQMSRHRPPKPYVLGSFCIYLYLILPRGHVFGIIFSHVPKLKSLSELPNSHFPTLLSIPTAGYNIVIPGGKLL